ncbi:MAG: hypothetical protein KF832_16315 [Caldilineaceae bacterium]|nr:hypothetical protein [Caldilineaceae bacterium]
MTTIINGNGLDRVFDLFTGSTVTLLQTGFCIITATQAGNSTFKAASPVTQSFTVTPALVKQNQTITFAPPADQMVGSVPVNLAATASSGLAASFVSDTPTVCTVSGTTVTLLAAGTCTITASQAGNAAFNAAPSITRSFQVSASGENPAQFLFLPLVRN